MHPWVGVSPQIINLQTELNYLNYIKIYSIFSNDLTPPIDPLNHSSIKPPMHPPMGGGVSTNHNSVSHNLQTELNYLDYVKID